MRSRRLTTVRTRTPNEESIRANAEIVALTQHPSWPALVQMIEEEIEATKRLTLTNVLSPGPINQVAILESRGFIKGARYILRVAAGAERDLEAELRKRPTEEAS